MNFIMKKKFFAIWRLNQRNGHRKLFDLTDDNDIAFSLCNFYSEKNNRCYYLFYVEDCSLAYSKYLLDDNLLVRCINIANCLELFDRCIKKSKFDKASYWFNLAKERSAEVSRILRYIDNNDI